MKSIKIYNRHLKKVKEELCKLIVVGNNEDYESMDSSLISPLDALGYDIISYDLEGNEKI